MSSESIPVGSYSPEPTHKFQTGGFWDGPGEESTER